MTLREEVIESLRKYFIEFTLLDGKKPCIQDWPNKPFKEKIPENQNFGVLCGCKESKIFVVDVDDFSLLPYFEKFLKITYVVKSGRGFHIYCKAKTTLPKILHLHNSSKQQIDILSTGAMVVAESCDHYEKNGEGNYQKTGKKYEKISIDRYIEEFDFEEDFVPILKKIGFDLGKTAATIERRDAVQSGLENGTRNNGLFKILLRSLDDGVDYETALEHIREINTKSKYPLSDDDVLIIFNSATKRFENKTKYTNRDSARELIEFAKNHIKKIVISTDNNSKFYGLIEINGHVESISLDSKRAVDWLRSKFYESTNTQLTADKVENTLSLICAQASFDSEIKREKINKRIASNNNSIYYDLCSPDWKLVKITENKVEIVNHGLETPIFERMTNQSQQITPNLDYKENPIHEFTKLVKFGNDSVFPIHLVSMFIDHIAIPMMMIVGQEDSAKSTRCALTKRVIDPRLVPPENNDLDSQLNHFPKNNDDLNINLSNNYCPVFENVSKITLEQSDTLCKAITGAGYSKRELYKNNDEIILIFRRKIILNGIPVTAEQSDLARRVIYYHTDRINKIGLDQVLEKFHEIQADLLGHIFTTLSKAISLFYTVRKEITEIDHMTDFTIWGEAISRSLGHEPGSFVTNYHQRMISDSEKLNDDNPAAPFIEELFKHKIDDSENPDEISLSFGECYGQLSSFADTHHYDKKNDIFPKSAGKIRGWIERSKPIIYKLGYEVEMTTYTRGDKYNHNTTILTVRKTKRDSEQATLIGVSN